MKVAIDVGNGYVKTVNEHGDKLHFPTVLKTKSEKALFNGKVKYTLKLGEKEYYVGDMAISKKGIRRWSNDKAMNEDTEKYAALCCHLLTASDESVIDPLILGLPYSFFVEQVDDPALTAGLQGKTLKTTLDGETKSLLIKSVKVFPQGVGAYFHNILNIDGNPKENASELMRALIICVGYRTVEVVAFDNINGEFVLVQEDSFTLEESGMINIVTHIVNVLSNDVQFDPNEIERWLRTEKGKVQYGGAEYDVSQYQTEAAKDLADTIVTAINAKLHGAVKKYNNIFVTGGGAEMLYPFIKLKYPNLRLQDDYIFANAEGYLAIASAQEK